MSDSRRLAGREMANDVFLLCIILAFFNVVCSAPVNVALNKPIRALFTCGSFGLETYYNHKDVSVADRDRDEMTCADTSVHPPQAMVDGNTSTKWQSTNSLYIREMTNLTSLPSSTDNLHAVIYLDLKQSFTVEKIILRMGDAKRPNFIAVHKSGDLTLGYDPWAYKVNIETECRPKFKVGPINIPDSQGSAVCSRYKQENSNTFGTIEFDFTMVPPEFREWRRARYLRIEFYEIDPTLSMFEAPRFQHFAVTELEVMAECVCNGHEIDCVLSNETQIYECVCGGNTMGQFCERCQPFFNQKAWQFTVPCEECNCFNHATECTYVKNLEENQRSLNKSGIRSGGGECINCLHNTAGVNCERCLTNYYRPVSVPQSDPNACVLCNCNSAGSTANPSSGIVGDCVMNNDTALPSGMQPGDCFCKTNVTGSKCDTCKAGYYGLTETNPAGCQACQCDPSGTVGGSQICTANQTGQCSCKNNVEGRACDVCKNGFYGLTVDDPNGCKPCECDPGGAASATCEKTSGQCYCRPKLQGRQCNSTIPGYYIPDVHFKYVDFETAQGAVTNRTVPGSLGNGYVRLGYAEKISPELNFPGGANFSGTCALLIRYSAPESTQASVQITSSDDPRPMTIPFPACSGRWCYVNTVTFRNVTFIGGSFHSIRFMSIGTLLLDRLVCIPVEFLSTDAFLGSSDFSTNCDVFNNDMRNGTQWEDTCKSGLFSLMSYYLNGPSSCDCSRLGSVNTVCESFGGNCQCKAGVGDRKCDQCNPGFFQLTDTGCRDCNCSTTIGVCDAVTGQCKCPANTIGLQCSQCNFNTWDWDATDGCKPCNCNSTGSESTWCNVTTGVCTCKNGVQGERCDQCADEYKGFNILGCSRCGCDSTGSLNNICHKVSGQCSCKENAAGPLCNQCRPGSFYLHSGNSKGCLDCICMGVATQCFSYTGRHQQKTVALIEAKDGGLSGTISVVNNTGGALMSPAVEVPPTSNNITTKTSISVIVNAADNVYWKIPDLTGNLLKLYGGIIQADVRYTNMVAQSGGTPAAAKAFLIGRNSKHFVHDVPQFAMNNATTSIKIALKESDWKNEGDSSQVTRGDFLLALTNVQIIMVPAVFSSTSHASFLSHLEYPVDGLGGVIADSVERCQCGAAYTGLSCESCAVGYMRTNVTSHAYLGVCVPCQCNNHATQCDPETGECLDCQHNTAGPKCELCATGYYGNATGGQPTDCIQCPCYEPRVANTSCSVVNTTIKCEFCNPGYTGDICESCLPFHYGNPAIIGSGTCTPCNCNGRSDSCDKGMGQCLNCQENTQGFNCERCIDGYYYSNNTNTCEGCGCEPNGSKSTTCDPTNGSCPCYQGIGGRTCNKCLDNYWGYTNSPHGCVACRCMEKGSQTLQCDDTSGLCACLPNVATVGNTEQCNECVAGYYGLPDIHCQACECNPTGTDPQGGACDLVTGQCPCKPGVTGRQCDRCKTLYIDFSDTGCKECALCQNSLGNDSQKLETKWNEAYSNSQAVMGVQAQDKQLQVLQTKLTTTMENLGLSGSNITSVKEMTDNITTIQSLISSDVETLQTKVNRLKEVCAIQQNNTNSENNRLKRLLADSLYTLDLSRTETQKGFNYQYRLLQYNQSAQQYLGQSTTTGSGIGLNFDTQLNKAMADNEIIVSDQRVENMQQKTDQQGGAITSLLAVEESVRGNYTAQITEMERMDTVLTTLKNQEDEIALKQAKAKAHKQQAEGNISETDSAKAEIKNITTSADTSKAAALTAHQQCQAIMSGSAADYLTNITLPSGVSNWNESYVELQKLHQEVSTKHAITEEKIKNSESKAQGLTSDATDLNDTFNIVRPRGDAAVKAITNFEKVIVTLNNSLATSDQAKTTIQDAQRILASVTVADLESQANASQVKSEQLLAEINGVNYIPEVLNSSLATARTALSSARAQWPPIETRLNELQMYAEGLNSDSGVRSNVTEAQTLAREADSLASNTLANLTRLNGTLNTEKAKADNVKTQVERTVELTRTVEEGAGSLKGRIDSINQTLDTITATKNLAAEKLPLLESNIDRIMNKLQEARRLLGRLQNPLYFNGTSGVAVTNPSVGVSLQYTDVKFKFKKDFTVSNALLFFMGNSLSQEEFIVEVVNNRVQMQFVQSGGSVNISSQADLCHNCWFQVQASKYYELGQLTVTKLSTGGIASDAATSVSKSGLSLESPLYYGSLPTGVVPSKVASRTGFRGCMHDVWFNGADIDIWNASITSENTPTCCRKPEVITPSLDQGVSFDGFGSLVLSAGDLNVSLTPLTLSLKFRTFNPNAYLVLVTSDSPPVKMSLYLTNGYIVFEYGTIGAEENRIQTSVQYNNGQWIVVSASRSTQNSLVVYHEGNAESTETVTPITANAVDLSPLRGANITIGADQSPSSVNPATKSKRFSGCMKDFTYRVGDGKENLISFDTDVVSRSGISNAGCPAKVNPGINFATPTSFASVSLPGVTSITTISLDIITTNANGILIYIPDQVTPSRVLYLALFNGNLVLDYHMTTYTRLSTNGIYISDGLRHSVLLDMSNSPTIAVDDRWFNDNSLPSSAFTKSSETLVNVGGSGDNSGIGSNYPVRSAFVGGISDFKINGMAIDIFKEGTIMQQQGSDLSGIPHPPSTPPPIPYTTPEPPTTPTPPTCGSPKVVTTDPNGIWFSGNSYWRKTLTSAEKAFFADSFSLSIGFEAFGPNGLLFMAADSIVAPQQRVLLYLNDGFLYFNVVGKSHNQTLKSVWNYNNGKRYVIDCLLYGTYMIMAESVVRKDWVTSNNGDPNVNHVFDNIGDIIIGNITSEEIRRNYLPDLVNTQLRETHCNPWVPFLKSILDVQMALETYEDRIGDGSSVDPFPVDLHSTTIPAGTSFQGAVFEVTVHSKNGTTSFNLEQGDPTISMQNIGAVPSKVSYGVLLNGLDSFINIGVRDMPGPLTVNLTLTNIKSSAMLFYIYEKPNVFIALDIVGYKARVVMGSDVASAFMLTSLDSTNFCDGLPHRYLVTLNKTGVEIKIDDNPSLYDVYPDNFPMPTITAGSIIVGGLHESALAFQGKEVSRESMQGCVQQVTINGMVYEPSLNLSNSNGASLACPL